MKNALLNKTDVLQDRQGLKLASYLSLGTVELPHDISERLRVARVQALSQRKVSHLGSARTIVGNGGSAALTWGHDEGLGLWSRIGAIVPLIALVVGMLLINSMQDDNRARELAEVDVSLLTDVLPPEAFADPGFIQFLKAEL
ncbi:MAG: DUF3619 family protein [Polaromonas sp.]|nr:DUF3619 family protein [Polaromonas sp.]